MAPAAAASTILSAAAASKRPAAQDSAVLQQQLECPRCQSTNTKFCYYNNYSTAQPRHFCRACRRYWTQGGTLRDVPVGGASRRTAGSSKRRRLSAEPEPSAPSSASATSPPCLLPPPDLSSAFPFLSDGSFLMPTAASAFPFSSSSWQSSLLPDFYDGLAPWDDVGAAAGVTGAWGHIAGLELTWPPPGN
ncbi:unnamed protein product [Urochloa decumbens]|uniref:Dof zinc finger protein n=1 Tax=Urochloa decumbens TaxID=240449 RepID=A0ABC9GTA1_9POAL